MGPLLILSLKSTKDFLSSKIKPNGFKRGKTVIPNGHCVCPSPQKAILQILQISLKARKVMDWEK